MVVVITLILIFIAIAIAITITWSQKEKLNNVLPLQEKVIVSLSTSPKRISKIEPVINNILEQTLVPDAIVLNLPIVFKRNNSKFTLPLPTFTQHSKILVNFVDDIGPITKVLPTAKLYSDPETIIISIDDDIIYPKNRIQELVETAIKYPNAVVTSSEVVKEELVEGWRGVLYRQKHLINFPIQDIKDFPRQCYLGDDLIISNYLKKNNVPIIYIPSKVPIPLQYGEEEDALHKSHDAPTFYGHDYDGCIDYLNKKQDYHLQRFPYGEKFLL
jgi:hypothetical protein